MDRYASPLCICTCAGEGSRKVGEVGERERVDVLSDKCCKGKDMTLG